MKYGWDEEKNRKNFAKHGLRFEDAELVFSGPCVTFIDAGLIMGKLGSSPLDYWPVVWWSSPMRRAMKALASSR
jgi:hypothetical protein